MLKLPRKFFFVKHPVMIPIEVKILSVYFKRRRGGEPIRFLQVFG